MLKKIVTICLVACFLFLLGACAPKPLTPFTVVLDYVPNTNHAGIYLAKAKGYYEKAGLDVRIVQPSDEGTAALIALGQGDVGISFQEDVTYARTADEPLPIVAIAAILQHNTSGFAALKEKGIRSPADFGGKTYVGWGSPSETAIVRYLAEKAGVDPDSIKIVTSSENFINLPKDQVDFSWIFYGWAGMEAETRDMDLDYLPLNDLDPAFDFYTPVIIASEDMIAQKKDVLRAFLDATAKGYSDCVQDPGDAAKIFCAEVPEYDLTFITRSLEYLRPYFMDTVLDSGPKWGPMKRDIWENYAGFMLENQLIARPLDVDKAYTNELLP